MLVMYVFKMTLINKNLKWTQILKLKLKKDYLVILCKFGICFGNFPFNVWDNSYPNWVNKLSSATKQYLPNPYLTKEHH